MSDTYIFSFFLIFILWILSTIAFLWTLKRLKSVVREREPSQQMDIFMGLVTAKSREAREATQTLRDAADALNIGLLELSGGRIKPINDAVSRLLSPATLAHPMFIDALGTLSDDSQKVMEMGKKVINLKKVSGKFQDSLILVQDITETFNMAKSLKQKEKLAVLGQMTAQMAHQVKTPIAVLAGKAQLLEKKLGSRPELKEQAHFIYSEARELAQRINEIVRFYKEPEPVMALTGIKDVFDAVKKRLDPLVGKDVKIVADCPEGLAISTDGEMLKNILFLMGQNAIFPEVSSKCLSFKAKAEKGSGHVDILIQDDGKGISEEIRGKIFEPFSGTRQEGLGLGLFLARDLTHRIKGSLELLDAPVGTIFLLRLPHNS
jgi:signal transduction histidine kinase